VDLRSPQIQPARLTKPVNELHLIGAEGRHDFGAGSLDRLERGRRLDLDPSRRFHRPDEKTADQVVSERSLAIQPAASSFRNTFVELRQKQPRRDVEVIDALGHRPRAGCGVPRELFFGERRYERVGVGRQAFELLPIGINFRRQRGMTIASHGIIVAAAARL